MRLGATRLEAGDHVIPANTMKQITFACGSPTAGSDKKILSAPVGIHNISSCNFAYLIARHTGA